MKRMSKGHYPLQRQKHLHLALQHLHVDSEVDYSEITRHVHLFPEQKKNYYTDNADNYDSKILKGTKRSLLQ